MSASGAFDPGSNPGGAICDFMVETGLDVEIDDILCVAHQNLDDSVVIVTFGSKTTGGVVSFLKDEIEEIK